jgi:hypothetical protein
MAMGPAKNCTEHSSRCARQIADSLQALMHYRGCQTQRYIKMARQLIQVVDGPIAPTEAKSPATG